MPLMPGPRGSEIVRAPSRPLRYRGDGGVCRRARGVRADEVLKRTFLGLDIGLPVDPLIAPIRACLAGEESSTTCQAMNRRGRAILCEVLVAPLRSGDGEIQGVILMMEPRGEQN